MAHRVDKNDTTFGYHDTNWWVACGGIDLDLANAERITEWVKEYWKALHPYSVGERTLTP